MAWTSPPAMLGPGDGGHLLAAGQLGVSFDQMLSPYQRRKVRLVGDIEEDGQNPGDESHDDELNHGQRVERIRNRDGAESEDPPEIGRDHDPVSAGPVDPHARRQADDEERGRRGGGQQSHLEGGGVERAHREQRNGQQAHL